MSSAEFYIDLPSNTIVQEHENNKTSNFTIILPEPLQFKDLNWEVGLAELIYCHSWWDLNKDASLVEFTYRKDGSKKTKQCHVPCRNYKSGKEIIEEINRIKPEDCKSKFAYEPVGRRITLEIHDKEDVTFNPKLAAKLGFVRDGFKLTAKDLNHPTTGAFKVFTARHESDTRAGLRSLYLYTDLIKGHLVGNSYLPLIRIIVPSAKTEHKETVQLICNPIYYFPIEKTYYNSITVRITDEFGDNVPFNHGNMIVKLHLRRRDRIRNNV